MAVEMGVAAQELSLEEVVPTSSSNGMLDDGKLDLVVVTVPEAATVEVCNAAAPMSSRVGSCCCSAKKKGFARKCAYPETCHAYALPTSI